MSYTIDRDTSQPSLSEMTQTALSKLHRSSKNGFFLLIEGSRIDMSSHTNDPATHVNEVLSYVETFHIARKFIEKHGGVLISTSDHVTGGIAVGRQISTEYPEYVWFPGVLANVTRSAEILSREIIEHGNDTIADLKKFITEEIII